jgi:hypothetical protein
VWSNQVSLHAATDNRLPWLPWLPCRNQPYTTLISTPFQPSTPPPLTTCIGSGRDLDRATTFHACDKLIFEPHFVRRSPIHLGFALLAPICSVLCEYLTDDPTSSRNPATTTATNSTPPTTALSYCPRRILWAFASVLQPVARPDRTSPVSTPQVNPELVRPFSILSYPGP